MGKKLPEPWRSCERHSALTSTTALCNGCKQVFSLWRHLPIGRDPECLDLALGALLPVLFLLVVNGLSNFEHNYPKHGCQDYGRPGAGAAAQQVAQHIQPSWQQQRDHVHLRNSQMGQGASRACWLLCHRKCRSQEGVLKQNMDPDRMKTCVNVTSK